MTLMVYTLAVPDARFETYAEYERFIRPQLEREYAGREYVLYVAPSPYYDVETLDIVGSWDVQRNRHHTTLPTSGKPCWHGSTRTL